MNSETGKLLPADHADKPRRTTISRPISQAIAIAVDLERTHDALSAIIGHSIPLPDRITVPGTTSAKRKPLTLPRNFTAEWFQQTHQNRLNALDELQDDIASTIGFHEAGYLYELVNEAHERNAGFKYRRPAPYRAATRSLDPDDRRSLVDLNRLEIERAADRPPQASPVPLEPEDPRLDVPEAIAIDLFVEGLLTYHQIDRTKLYQALDQLRATSKSETITFATPAMRSNKYPTLAIFGEQFPKAVFRLRGRDLETQLVEMLADDPAHYEDVWTYKAVTPTNITLSRSDFGRRLSMHMLERRALSDVIPDPRFHDALVVERANRTVFEQGLAKITLNLRAAYAYLDPPGSRTFRPEIRRPSDLKVPGPEHKAYPDLQYADQLIDEVAKRQWDRRYRVEPIDGGGLLLRLSEEGRYAFFHRFIIARATLEGGAPAIRGRLDIIQDMMTHGRHTAGPILAVPSPTPALPTDSAEPELEPETPNQRFARLHTAEAVEQWIVCSRIDALLFDRLGTAASSPDDHVEFHYQEGLLALKSIRLAADLNYRLERFDRVLGKITHVIGVIEIERQLSPASIEALRDGTASQILPGYKEFGRAQVRKITKHDDMVSVTVRVPIFDRPDSDETTAQP